MKEEVDIVEERWDKNISHYPRSLELVQRIRDLDIADRLDLQLGGDGDLDEDLAYILDELIDRGWTIYPPGGIV